MADFSFLLNKLTKKWVISAPRRAARTNTKSQAPICPFCLGNELVDEEVYRVGGEKGDSNWQIRVVANKFPFTKHHEVIIHSPDHHKNFDELPFSQVELILQTYRQRYRANRRYGQVYIFHNCGHGGGESIPHPHSQLTVVDDAIKLPVPPLAFVYGDVVTPQKAKKSILAKVKGHFQEKPMKENDDVLDTEHFYLFCPLTSEWPDEVWIAPRLVGTSYGDMTDEQLSDLSFVLSRLIHLYTMRYGHEFPFNFYIAPGINWYLRLIPRQKILGGFELGTGIMVNTQDPKQTIAFIKEHFWEPDYEKIKQHHQADYWKQV